METNTLVLAGAKREEKKRNPRGVYEKVLGSGVYWIRFVDSEGKLRREKAGTRGNANDLLVKRRNEVLIGRKLPEKLRQRPATFGEVAQAACLDIERRHKRPQNGLAQLAKAVEWFGSREATSMTPGQIEAKLSAVADAERWAASTYNHHLTAVSLVFRLGLRAGTVTTNPARLVPRRAEKNVRQGFITDAQYAALAGACGSALWLRTMLALGRTYGWRAGELVGLRVGQVDLGTRTVRLDGSQTKNGQGRIVRLTAECFEVVSASVAGKGVGDSVLTYENGQPVHAYRFAWEQLCVRAGAGRFVCGACGMAGRRTAVRGLERAGVPRSVAMKITGHKTESVYRRYAIVSEADLSEAVSRLEQLTPQLAPAPQAGHGERAKVN